MFTLTLSVKVDVGDLDVPVGDFAVPAGVAVGLALDSPPYSESIKSCVVNEKDGR